MLLLIEVDLGIAAEDTRLGDLNDIGDNGIAGGSPALELLWLLLLWLLLPIVDLLLL